MKWPVTSLAQSPEDLLDAYRQALRHVAATVYAITTGVPGDRHGILATAVSSLSFDPPSLLVCINRSASLHEPLVEAPVFAVNVLGQGNRDIAARFTDARGEERFHGADWQQHCDVPVLSNAQSNFVCRKVDTHTFGTHTIFIGELIAASHRADAPPLTYFDRHYIDISEAPELNG